VTGSPAPLHLGRAAGVQTLPQFSPVACRLIQLVSDEKAHVRELAQVFALDAGLSSDVLRVANSALVGCRYEIASILQAVLVVGADRLRDIAVTVAMKEYLGQIDAAVLHRCWRHNLATALWCERLVKYCDVEPAGIYTAGILHDIGRVALLMLFPREYPALLAHPPADGPDCRAAERRLFDADHCQIGHNLSVSWNFPAPLIDIIARHHEDPVPESPGQRLVVQAACTAASISGFRAAGHPAEFDPAPIDRLLPRKRNGAGPNYQDLLESVALKLNQTECSLL
jgi:HD-like signal output (HDOD) protein